MMVKTKTKRVTITRIGDCGVSTAITTGTSVTKHQQQFTNLPAMYRYVTMTIAALEKQGYTVSHHGFHKRLLKDWM